MTFPPYQPALSNAVAAAASAATAWTDGDANGTWASAGNWDNGIPGNGDTAVLATSSRTIGSSNQSAKTLEWLLISDDYTGDLGQLRINAINVVIRKRQGTVNLSGWFQNVWIMNTAGGSASVTLVSSTAGQKIGALHIMGTRGTISIPANSFVDFVHITPVGGNTARVTAAAGIQRSPNPLDIGASTLSKRFRVGRAGFLTAASAATNNDILGDALYTDGVGNSIDTHASGRCRWQSDNKVDGAVNVWSGLFTLAGNGNSSLTIDDITIHPEGAANLALPAGTVTLTNPADVRPGGRLYVGPGVTETVA